MSAQALLAFNVTLLAAWVVPGPAMLYALHATLFKGRGAGVAAGLGLALAAAGWTLLALLGLDAVFRLFPWAFAALKIGGAAYLLWIAVRTWRAAGQPVEAATPSAGRAALGGALVNLANPKSVLFSAAVLVVIFPPGLALPAKALIVANHLAFEILVYGLLALLVSTPAVAARYRRAKGALDRVSAAVLGALGLRLLIER